MDDFFSGVGEAGDWLTGQAGRTAVAPLVIPFGAAAVFVAAVVATWAIEKGLDFAWDNREEIAAGVATGAEDFADFTVSTGDYYYKGSASNLESAQKSFAEMQNPDYWMHGSFNGNPI
jgi:hypothetical protein